MSSPTMTTARPLSTIAPLVLLAACGGRVASNSESASTSVTAGAPLACTPGDAPVTLVTGIKTQSFNALATDGVRLYVAQTTAPQLWTVDTRGAGRVDLYANDQETISGSLALLPSNGGIYFNAFDAPEHVVWMSSDGRNVRNVSPMVAMRFDATANRAFTPFSGFGPGTIQTIALADGAVKPFVSLPAGIDVEALAITHAYLHVVLFANDSPTKYTDARYALADGALHDSVPLQADNMQIVSGPSAICVLANDARGIDCLEDGESVDRYIAVESRIAPFVLSVDDQWVYVTADAAHPFERLSLDGARSQILSTDDYARAATSYAGCVYVATGSGSVLRLSPPP